jgi:hypothetical protein
MMPPLALLIGPIRRINDATDLQVVCRGALFAADHRITLGLREVTLSCLQWPRKAACSGFASPDTMSALRRHRILLLFVAILVLCSVLVIRQFTLNRERHVELREAFILLEVKGYRNEAQRLFQRLLAELPSISNQQLLDDFQRTITLVNPLGSDTENLIWRYHWTVSNEFERRSEKTLERALKMAEGE